MCYVSKRQNATYSLDDKLQFVLLENTQAKKAFDILKKEYPDAHYYLDFKTPLQLLVAAILSAQTRDEIVNASTPALFKKFHTAIDFASTTQEELNKYINKITFFGNKSKNIIAACKLISEKYNGEVPKTMEELISLPGVGRKTANTILINVYNIVNGIPVDTWVIKLSDRIGFSKNKDPDKIEQDLLKIINKEDWKIAAYIFKTHGKKICQSITPICSICPIKNICPKNGVSKSK